jgi:hypothetical protein
MIKAAALLAVALVVAGPAARAQTYPSRQITLIIPFTPGARTTWSGVPSARSFPRRGGSRWWSKTVVAAAP